MDLNKTFSSNIEERFTDPLPGIYIFILLFPLRGDHYIPGVGRRRTGFESILNEQFCCDFV